MMKKWRLRRENIFGVLKDGEVDAQKLKDELRETYCSSLRIIRNN